MTFKEHVRLIMNYDTGEHDAVTKLPDDPAPYIPKGAPRGLYQVYVAMGDDPLDAYIKVYEKLCRVKDE